MHLIRKVPTIGLEEIMQRVEPYDVYRYYGGEFTVGAVKCNPIIKQETGSFGIYIKDGKLYHSDFAIDMHGDCVAFVRQMFHLSLPEAINKIARDFGISSDTGIDSRIVPAYRKPVMDQKRHSLIQIEARSWTAKDIEYWNQYGITLAQLRAEEVYCVKNWSINRKRQHVVSGEKIYAYRYPIGFQVLMPDRKKEEKWKTNIPHTFIEGWEKVDQYDKILITKAKKDKIYLQNLLPDIAVMRTMNESVAAYTPAVVEKLRGKQIWINDDNDPPGKRASWKVTQLLQCKHLNCPDALIGEGISDYTDWRKARGCNDEIIEHLKLKGLIT